MKKLLMGLGIALAWLTFSSPLSADDYYPAAYNGCCAQQSFDGFYIGGNVGFISYSPTRTDLDGYLGSFDTDIYAASRLANDTSWAAGVQLGYDWRWCRKLIGLVVDWDWSNAQTNTGFLVPPVSISGFIEGRLRWFTTIRARAGLAINDALFYFTAGAAVADIRTRYGLTNILTGSEVLNNTQTRWGWTAGLGTEFALWSNWSLNAEVLYMRFASRTVSFNSRIRPSTVSFNHNDDAWTGRLGLNYRFSFCNFW